VYLSLYAKRRFLTTDQRRFRALILLSRRLDAFRLLPGDGQQRREQAARRPA
jgi:hypothetical protein